MPRQVYQRIALTDELLRAWDELHEGLHEGTRRERKITVSLAKALLDDIGLCEVLTNHIRFCGLPIAVHSFLPRMSMLRQQLRATRRPLCELVESENDAALLIVRHPHVVQHLLRVQDSLLGTASAEKSQQTASLRPKSDGVTC